MFENLQNNKLKMTSKEIVICLHCECAFSIIPNLLKILFDKTDDFTIIEKFNGFFKFKFYI